MPATHTASNVVMHHDRSEPPTDRPFLREDADGTRQRGEEAR